jgi:hypothetical protein
VHAAILENEKHIDRLDPDRPMRHHHHDGAALARRANRPRQRLVALGIEIGIRLIQNDQERIARANATRCAWPAESAAPCSPIWVS